MLNPQVWITRAGVAIKLTDLASNHFHNVVVYVHTEIQEYGNTFLRPYWPALLRECDRRQLAVEEILHTGVGAYTDAQGLVRIWDAPTNSELVAN